MNCSGQTGGIDLPVTCTGFSWLLLKIHVQGFAAGTLCVTDSACSRQRLQVLPTTDIRVTPVLSSTQTGTCCSSVEQRAGSPTSPAFRL